MEAIRSMIETIVVTPRDGGAWSSSCTGFDAYPGVVLGERKNPASW